MDYSPEMRKMISDQAEGKTVKSLVWEDDGYWVMTFTDDTELCFRFMSELAA